MLYYNKAIFNPRPINFPPPVSPVSPVSPVLHGSDDFVRLRRIGDDRQRHGDALVEERHTCGGPPMARDRGPKWPGKMREK